MTSDLNSELDGLIDSGVLDEAAGDLLSGALDAMEDEGLTVDLLGEASEDLLNEALDIMDDGELTSDLLQEVGDDLLDAALDTIEDGLAELDVGGAEDLLDAALGVLEGNDETFSGDNRNSAFIDPLEEKVTSIRNGEHPYMSTVAQFTSILASTGIHGPRHLRQYNLKTRAVKIGNGAQFTVFRECEGAFSGNEGLVIKRVNVPLSREEGVSFASGEDYRLNLRTLELEVRSLCNPLLRNHRNMVQLVAWGYDYPLPDTPVPVLFVESALTTLTDFLKEGNRELMGDNSMDIKYQLALDIVAGIEALHSLNIVHGDIKPDNVLVFKDSQNEKVPFCAKISDFGVCVDMEVPGSEFTIDNYRGTPGWVAPEIQDVSRWNKKTFKPEVMLRFDSYSLGLTLLSLFIKQGEPVNLEYDGESRVDVAIYLLREEEDMPSDLRMQLTRTFRGLLAEDSWARPLPNPNLLKMDKPAYAAWLSTSQTGRRATRYVGTTDQMYNRGANFWRRLDKSVITELEEQYRASKGSFQADVLFGLAQSITRQRPSYVDSLLEYVTESARGGYSPARAVYAQLMHAHRRKPEFSSKVLTKWTLQAVSEGYMFAAPSPAITQDDLDSAKQRFRDAGGFVTAPFLQKGNVLQAARDLEKATSWLKENRKIVDNKGNTLLHAAAALGSLEVVRSLIENGKIPLDIQNDNQETPLYTACQAGHVKVIDYLLDNGARASIATKQERLTALHWLFTLPAGCVCSVATRLVREAGALVDAKMIPPVAELSGGAPQRTQISHFPFELPLGTPLHWAAFARSTTAMGALLKLGADIHATYHNADIGSSPLFLAAWYGEIDVVRFLLSKGAEAMTKDPKGRNILHYLAFCQLDYHGSLPYSWHYWIRHGDWDEHIKQTTELAKLLIDAGADINAVSQVPRQTTPIRIASEEWDGGVVCALAQLGADVETGTMDTVLHAWAYIRASGLTYPESYFTIFKSVAKNMKNINARGKYDEETPLHRVVAALHHEEEVEGACDILFAHDPPPDINAINRKGWTPIYYALLTERDPFRQAIYFLKKNASLTTVTNDGKNIFFPVTYNVVFTDKQSHDLILELLNHIVRTESGLKDVKDAYQKHFLKAPANLLSLSEAAKAGRELTLTLLLDLGLEQDINKLVETDPPCTVLDQALLSAASRRYDHMESLASYTSAAARKRARAAGNVYGNRSNESQSRAAEAYTGMVKVLRILRFRGAKRAFELGSLSNEKPLSLRDMYPKYWLHPDLCDVINLYWLGFTPETQPNRHDWDILYELSRCTGTWREQLVDILREWYEDDVWRPDLKMLERAGKAQQQEKTNTMGVPDNDFFQKILVMLTTLDKAGLNVSATDAKDKVPVWIEARETTCSGANSLHRTTPGYILEVELMGGKGTGNTRRVKAPSR